MRPRDPTLAGRLGRWMSSWLLGPVASLSAFSPRPAMWSGLRVRNWSLD